MTAQFTRALPTVLIGSVLAAAAAVAGGGDSLPRTLVVLWFLLACPGAAVVINLRLRRGWAEAALALALSISIDTVVAGTLFYLDAWSPALAFTILAAVTVSGAAVAATRPGVQPGVREDTA